MSQIQMDLSHMGVPDTHQFALNVHTAMSGSAIFPTPNPTLTAFNTLITTAQTTNNAYEAEKDVLVAKKNERDDAMEALRNGLRAMASYVQSVSGGDRVKIESAGFSVKGAATPIGVPGQVLNLVLTSGDNDGSLDGSWDPVRGASSYEIQTSVDPVTPTSWQYNMSVVKSSTTIGGLPSTTRQWVRVRAIGSAGPGPWSDPATKTVP